MAEIEKPAMSRYNLKLYIMNFKLDDFKIFSITELNKVVGGRMDCDTASYGTSSDGGCDDDWDWDD